MWIQAMLGPLYQPGATNRRRLVKLLGVCDLLTRISTDLSDVFFDMSEVTSHKAAVILAVESWTPARRFLPVDQTLRSPKTSRILPVTSHSSVINTSTSTEMLSSPHPIMLSVKKRQNELLCINYTPHFPVITPLSWHKAAVDQEADEASRWRRREAFVKTGKWKQRSSVIVRQARLLTSICRMLNVYFPAWKTSFSLTLDEAHPSLTASDLTQSGFM